MNDPENESSYLFTTKKECCDEWFPFADDCEGSTASQTEEKFYPVYDGGNTCSKKQVKDFEGHENERYGTLEECCVAKFSHNKQQCCDAPGMGGCAATGEIVYIPDWTLSKCDERSRATLLPHEEYIAEASRQECCDWFFRWNKDCSA